MEIEPTYRTIEYGDWRDDSVRGIGEFCIDWAFEKCGHLRVDTHGDNRVMQKLLEKCGFTHCGTICVEEDCYSRLAYEKS